MTPARRAQREAALDVEGVQRPVVDRELDRRARIDRLAAVDARGELRALVVGEQDALVGALRVARGLHGIGGHARRVDREDQVALGPELLDHVDCHAHPRQRRVGRRRHELEVGRADPQNHASAQARERGAGRQGDPVAGERPSACCAYRAALSDEPRAATTA